MHISSITIAENDLKRLCRKWKIRRLEIFGSALHKEMTPESDIDLLVEFEPDERWSLMDLVRAEEEFAAIFKRRVDLVDKQNLVISSNWIRKNSILQSAEVIYGS